ncbi:MAG: sigma-70 family RNA polymerase sigma factor [Pseudomonadota bacterium]
METDGDAQLVARLAEGDRTALSVLFARHHTRIYRFLVRLTGNDAIADELANEVFLELWRKPAAFKGQARVSTYLFAIARFKAISVRRKRSEAALDEETMTELVDDSDTPEVASQKSDKSKLLEDAVNALPEEFRVVVDLAYYQELSMSEIASILEIEEATVRTRMFRARKRLAVSLTEAGVDRGWP